MPEPRRAPDLPGAIGSAVAVAVGLAVLWVSGDYSSLGSVFPRTIGALLVALGVAYLVLVLLGRTRRPPAPEGSNLRRAAVAAVMLGWGFALQPLGFLGSSALAFALLLAVASHERWTPRAMLLYPLAGALVLGGLYGLFKIVLLVPLP